MKTKAPRTGWLMYFAVCGLLVGCSSGVSGRGVSSGSAALNSNLRLPDLEGKLVNPFAAKNARALVFVFVRTDCPISNRYVPELKRLHKKFAPQHVAFTLIYPEDTAADVRQHRSEYGIDLPELCDPKHLLVKAAKASVTPEAAVFVPGRGEVYHGRIDDHFVDFGKERPAATQHDLEDVLTAVLAGKPVANSHQPAIGCYISDAQ